MGNYSLLVVDDEPDIRQLLRIFFERQGWAVNLANNGKVGVELARKTPPDLILLDIQMPVMTGIEAVRELRSDPRFKTMPIIALTAYARVHMPADVIRAGFDEVIHKPLDFSHLYETVQKALVAKGKG